jgi:hydrogenase maturation protease
MTVLVAGIGNVFLGDDGFGVEVIRRLDPSRLPEGVVAADYGIRGLHLAYDLLDGRYQTLIMVDAVPTGEPPGTVSAFEVDGADDAGPERAPVNAHVMHPEAVLATVHTLGGRVERVLVVGCEPASVQPVMGLTEPVRAAVGAAVDLLTELAVAEAARQPAGTR